MSYSRLIRPAIGLELLILYAAGCGTPAATREPSAPAATRAPSTPAPTPEPPTTTPTPTTATPGPPTPPPPTPAPEPVSTPTAVASPYPQPDLSNRPLIFFGALPQPDGSLDFMDLFTEDAPWATAARRVQVYNLFGGWVAHFPWEPAEATDDELRQIITDLNRRGIAIGFEASPLVATEECGRGIEGFFGPEEGLRIVGRLKQLGATVRYVSLDEPFAFGHIYDGPQACRWPAEKIAR